MKCFKNMQSIFRYLFRTASILSSTFSSKTTYDQAVGQLRERISGREDNFLRTLERTIFNYKESPYLKLLNRAGYDFPKLRAMIREKGIEESLEILMEDGVYIDILEFKGKKKTIRGSDVFSFRESDFSNPLLNLGFDTKSGGSRSSGSRMTVPGEFINQNNIYGIMASHEYSIPENPVIIYLPILPAGEGLFFNIRFTAMGTPPAKWFSQIDEHYIKPSWENRLKTVSSIWMARFYGKKMPYPEYVDIREPGKIAAWMGDNLGASEGYSMVTYASSALRLIIEARKRQINLGRTVFWLMGEPLTEKIYSEIESYGCRAFSLYGCNELMLIGQGCANPAFSDDMHFCKDKLALIQHERHIEHSDEKVNAFYFTTLLDTSPKIFLNTETGDYGVVEERSCNCGFEKAGFNTHIHSVKSFEKLTAEGATFLGNDLLSLIQEVLPGEFGGCATDYQFVEEQDSSGFHKLFLFVSPGLGSIDERKIRKIAIDTLMGDSDIHSYSRIYWERGDTRQVKRKNPVPTARGKILPLQIRPAWSNRQA